MIPQETTFTIGQFAAIHGIHKKTLMWYDQVGLLSPAFVGENGYRYYSYRQSARLETILMLRALEVSIPEIKTFLSHRSAGELRRLLTEKIAGVEGQIRRLEEIRHALVRQQASLARLETLPLTQISLVRRETCYLATVPLPGDTPTDREIAAVIDLFYPQLGVKLCSMAGGGVQKIYMVFFREPSRRDRSGSDLFHLRDGFEIKMNFDRNVSCFIFVNALMHDDFFD